MNVLWICMILNACVSALLIHDFKKLSDRTKENREMLLKAVVQLRSLAMRHKDSHEKLNGVFEKMLDEMKTLAEKTQ